MLLGFKRFVLSRPVDNRLISGIAQNVSFLCCSGNNGQNEALSADSLMSLKKYIKKRREKTIKRTQKEKESKTVNITGHEQENLSDRNPLWTHLSVTPKRFFSQNYRPACHVFRSVLLSHSSQVSVCCPF